MNVRKLIEFSNSNVIIIIIIMLCMSFAKMFNKLCVSYIDYCRCRKFSFCSIRSSIQFIWYNWAAVTAALAALAVFTGVDFFLLFQIFRLIRK